MTVLLRNEFLKLKRKHFIFVIVLMTLLEVAWVFVLTADAKQEFLVWENLILNLGVLNGMFLPIVIAVIVSRLVDAEHKENTWKMLLATPIHKPSLYVSKLAMSMFLLLIPTIILFFSILVIGNVLDFPGSFPMVLTIRFVMTTWLSSICIVALQIWISIIIKNQAFALMIGVIGSFLGYFGQMLPISKFVMWTYPSITSPVTFDMINNQIVYEQNTSSLINLCLSIFVGIILILAGLNHFMRKDTN